MPTVTLKDVAKVAGVSYATVSRAISGSPEISEETRRRILKLTHRPKSQQPLYERAHGPPGDLRSYQGL